MWWLGAALSAQGEESGEKGLQSERVQGKEGAWGGHSPQGGREPPRSLLGLFLAAPAVALSPCAAKESLREPWRRLAG